MAPRYDLLARPPSANQRGQEYHYRDAIQHPEHDQDVEHSAEVMEDQRDRQGNQK